MNYRKELKFIVTDSLLEIVKNRILPIMDVDEHQEGDFYNIRSIYFDSPDNKCLFDNISGVDDRYKYRIRTYDCNPDVINMEIKHRFRTTIQKSSAPISKECLEGIIAGDFDVSYLLENAKVSDFAMKLSAEHFGPKCVVEYDRSAFVYKPCNVRITFDRNIRTFNNFEQFFVKDVDSTMILPPGCHVLEIKYDEFLPVIFEPLLEGLNLERSSFSKYARCMEV